MPDPQDPLIVYGSGLGGTITRYDGRTGEVRNVSLVESSYGRRPTPGTYRWAWAFPIAIAKKAPYTMYTGAQYLLRSPDRGVTWEKASRPDGRGRRREGLRRRGHGAKRASLRFRRHLDDRDLAARFRGDLGRDR